MQNQYNAPRWRRADVKGASTVARALASEHKCLRRE